MYSGLLHSHSLNRYFVMIMLVVVIITSFAGWLNNRPYSKLDNKLGLYLVIFTHLQFVIGLVLYFLSAWVQFNDQTMKDDTIRYWTVEHGTGMLIAVALITAARSTAKKMAADKAKHKRMAIFSLIALLVIVAVITLSGRGILSMSAFN